MKRTFISFLMAGLLALSGCAGAQPTPTATSADAARLEGDWQQFIPVQSMPESLSLTSGGSAVVGGAAGTWKLEDGNLVVRQGREERHFTYTLSGYMLTLYDPGADASSFYINPETFRTGQNSDGELAGQWAAFSTFSMMLFDGRGRLDDVVYNTAGRVALQRQYTARDGILMSVDDGGNYTFNLYSFSKEGALLLAETTEFDNDDKQWSPYWKLTVPDKDLLVNWSRVVCLNGEGNLLPSAMQLKDGGMGSFTGDGGQPTSVQWEYYQDGFLVLRLMDTDVRYAYVNLTGPVLYLGNDENQAWYVDEARFHPDAEGLKGYVGRWKSEDGAVFVQVEANGRVTVTNDNGQTTVLSGSAADGLWKLEQSNKTYYIAAAVEDGVLNLHWAGLPFLQDTEMPVTLTKE